MQSAISAHTLCPRDTLTVRRIVKVNHAGEHGAIQIYSAQIAISRWLYPDIVETLAEMRGHEIQHREHFRASMPARQSRPCRIMSLWSGAGWLLGFITALMGRQAIWVCTAAVESTVHHHLDDQLHFLTTRDSELLAIISSIREEELAHLANAQRNIADPGIFAGVLNATISTLTDAIIWLSTWGDSARLARDLANAGRRHDTPVDCA